MADLAVWQRTIVDEEGNVIPGAEIEVRREEDDSLATLYADRAGETPLANPLAADMSGFVRFFAQGDAYTITAVGAGSTRTWRFDPTGRLQEFDKVIAEIVSDDGGEQAAIRDKLGAVARSSNLSDLTNLKDARSNLGEFATVADVENANIPPVLESIRTNGYYTPGDGPVLNLVRGSNTPGAIQSADGQWWEDLGYNSIVVRIPSDFPTLQEAVDHWSRLPVRAGSRIELRIESGHALTSGLVVEHGDYAHFIITSDDAEVPLTPNFSGTIISGNNASMPTLACLIDASNQTSGNGLTVYRASRIHIEEGCGIKNAYATALLARYGSSVSAEGTVWTGAARNGNTGAGITAWGAYIDARQADVSNSSYYGAQAAHGGLLNFMNGIANDCGRHGIRATDAAVVDATGAQANRCGANGSGYNVYAYEGGIINFSSGSANDCGGADNLMAFGASTINARSASATGAARYGAFAEQGSTINVMDATISGNAGDLMTREGTITSTNSSSPIRGPYQGTQTVEIRNGIVEYIPNPSGITTLLVDTNAQSPSDDLDVIRPVPGYGVRDGDIVFVAPVASSRPINVRPYQTSGAGVGAFNSIPHSLESAIQTVGYIRRGSYWNRITVGGV